MAFVKPTLNGKISFMAISNCIFSYLIVLHKELKHWSQSQVNVKISNYHQEMISNQFPI